MTTARRVALDALVAVDRGSRANTALAGLLAGSHLDQRDRNLATDLTYGTCRMRRACDWLALRHARGRLDAEVHNALRLGTYQLLWTRVPAHAAVSATVAEVRGPGRSLVNAVLRKVAASLESGPPRWPDLATELSYPDWIVSRLEEDLGRARARAALEAMNQPAAVTLRADGYAQDRASQMVVEHLAVREGERLLDVCAAPGGKATAAADAGPRLVVAADVSSERTALTVAHAARTGSPVRAVVADGRFSPWPTGTFDRVLVDAPCSGLGALRRRPDARWRVHPGDVDRLTRLQTALVAEAARVLRPGGVLVYSVCTLTAAETRKVDGWVQRRLPDLRPLPPPGPPWEHAGRGGLLLPQTEGTDGMFVLAFQAPAGAPVG